jgi:two-component system chemotaxis response regulator CheY
MYDLTKLKAMVVDDVSTVRLVISKSLKSLGMTDITQSSSLDDAWESLEGEFEFGTPIDIIFCDWNMPGGDGIDLLKKLRAHKNPKFRLTKFVMLTGANDKVLEAMDEGAHNIIHKPFSMEIIKEKLDLIFS